MTRAGLRRLHSRLRCGRSCPALNWAHVTPNPISHRFSPHRRQGRLCRCSSTRRRAASKRRGSLRSRPTSRRCMPSKRDILVVFVRRDRASGRAIRSSCPRARRLKLEDSQAAAAVRPDRARAAPGRRRSAATKSAPARCWSRSHRASRSAGAYLNARNTIAKLLEWRAVPVINENDTVATSEIRYGDNDRLAARVATMASADVLVLLSGHRRVLRRAARPQRGCCCIPLVERITPRRSRPRAGRVPASELSRGGMVTKIEAAKIATTGGTHLVIGAWPRRQSAARHHARARAAPGSSHRPIRSRRARNGSPVRSNRKAR